jgi:hypothetical protein
MPLHLKVAEGKGAIHFLSLIDCNVFGFRTALKSKPVYLHLCRKPGWGTNNSWGFESSHWHAWFIYILTTIDDLISSIRGGKFKKIKAKIGGKEIELSPDNDAPGVIVRLIMNKTI